ncbi:hypothetical protein HaLaN_07570 [Haematococcus lacustris]|uniref:Uncharacterized protein n=1 Tax=Haematococcus lacustris TaxID=44745 RepID=A0A699YY91_HAELA|nr:hypothetical protein HaLaN_07570 [Haematococcus lacustris]
MPPSAWLPSVAAGPSDTSHLAECDAAVQYGYQYTAPRENHHEHHVFKLDMAIMPQGCRDQHQLGAAELDAGTGCAAAVPGAPQQLPGRAGLVQQCSSDQQPVCLADVPHSSLEQLPGCLVNTGMQYEGATSILT